MKELEAIWNVPIEEVRRQCAAGSIECDYNIPLEPEVDALDACIEGSRQILANERFRAMFQLSRVEE